MARGPEQHPAEHRAADSGTQHDAIPNHPEDVQPRLQHRRVLDIHEPGNARQIRSNFRLQSGFLKQEPRVLSAPFWILSGGLMAMVRCDGDFLDRDRRLRRDPGMTGLPSGSEGWRRSRPEGALSQALSAGWCSRSFSGSRGRGAGSWRDCAWSGRRRARAA